MARLQPTPSTVKKLFAYSGNICASPTCNNSIIDNDVVLGEICHIEAAEENGPRYNKNSNDEYRRSYDNLILLCEKCHKIIDNNEKQFMAPIISTWKTNHENKYKNANFPASDSIITDSIRKFMEQNNPNSSSGTQFNNQAKIQNIGNQIGTQNIYSDEKAKSKNLKIDGVRKNIPELKALIDEFRSPASPPDKDIIDFKNELIDRTERSVELIPHKYLKFRKENGRIKSDVESYEKINQINLDEADEETQIILRGFLSKNDLEKKEVLKEQIRHKTQQKPAIITCDGFLINGNRRKMVLEELFVETHQDSRFENMRVVILPENVTELDISKIENRYQMQDEGKSEYSGLNRALTIRDNIKKGYILKAQLKDDPKFANKNEKDFDAEVKRIEKEFLQPLECADRYLELFGREKLYNTISESSGDKEGRWQAFIDYSSFYNSTLMNEGKRHELGIPTTEAMKIDNAILKIIRKRDLNSKQIEKALGKVHFFVRGGNLRKYVSNPTARKFLLKIADVDEQIPEKEKFDKDNKKLSEREIDIKWGNINQEQILGNLMQAYKIVYEKGERDKPLELLEDALHKLNHENLQIDNMGTEHFEKALELTKSISEKADEIHNEIDHARYNMKKLEKKGK